MSDAPPQPLDSSNDDSLTVHPVASRLIFGTGLDERALRKALSDQAALREAFGDARYIYSHSGGDALLLLVSASELIVVIRVPGGLPSGGPGTVSSIREALCRVSLDFGRTLKCGSSSGRVLEGIAGPVELAEGEIEGVMLIQHRHGDSAEVCGLAWAFDFERYLAWAGSWVPLIPHDYRAFYRRTAAALEATVPAGFLDDCDPRHIVRLRRDMLLRLAEEPVPRPSDDAGYRDFSAAVLDVQAWLRTTEGLIRPLVPGDPARIGEAEAVAKLLRRLQVVEEAPSALLEVSVLSALRGPGRDCRMINDPGADLLVTTGGATTVLECKRIRDTETNPKRADKDIQDANRQIKTIIARHGLDPRPIGLVVIDLSAALRQEDLACRDDDNVPETVRAWEAAARGALRAGKNRSVSAAVLLWHVFDIRPMIGRPGHGVIAVRTHRVVHHQAPLVPYNSEEFQFSWSFIAMFPGTSE